MPTALLHPDGTLDVDAVRHRLGDELSAILDRHGKIRDHLHNADRKMPADWSEAAQLIENDEVLEALEESGREAIASIQNALRRIADGEYTECVRCGEEINPRRLAALPTTTLCVRCAAD